MKRDRDLALKSAADTHRLPAMASTSYRELRDSLRQLYLLETSLAN